MKKENEDGNKTKEDETMNATVEHRRLDFEKLRSRITDTISTEESLKDILPIPWSKDVLDGSKKVIITKESNLN